MEHQKPRQAAALQVVFLVSGEQHSAMGIRARSLAEYLRTSYRIEIGYRSARKVGSIFSLLVFLVRTRPLAVYLFDVSYTGILAGGIYRLLFRAKLIVETGDAIVELVRSTGSRGRIGLWLTEFLESTAFRIADKVVVRGTFHKELLARRGVEAEVIQDGVDTTSWVPSDKGELREQFKLSGSLVIGLVGSSVWSEKLQMCYGWELIETLRLLKHRPVKGMMIGGGSGIAHLESRAAEYGVEDRMIFTGPVPYDQLPKYLRTIDICLSTQTNDVVGQVRTTGKLPLYLAQGRYVLASRVGEAARVLPDEMLVDYDGVRDEHYPLKLKERIEMILNHPEMLERGRQLPSLAKKHFDYAILSERMNKVISATIGGSKVRSVTGA